MMLHNRNKLTGVEKASTTVEWAKQVLHLQLGEKGRPPLYIPPAEDMCQPVVCQNNLQQNPPTVLVA